MIFYPDNDDKAKLAEAATSTAPESEPTQPSSSLPVGDPPPYTPTDLTSHRPLPAVKASNFVSVARVYESIRGTWVIDPSLSIPTSFLPPLPVGDTEEARKNLYLETTNGAVEGDVTVIPRSVPARRGRAERNHVILHAGSSNGIVTLKLHDPPPSPTHALRPPVHITAYSSNGAVSIRVPRSFRGPLSLKTRNGRIKFSNDVQMHMTTFSEEYGVHNGFLGNFEAGVDEGWEWAGDRLWAESKNGEVAVKFDDEGVGELGRGFFGRLFGF